MRIAKSKGRIVSKLKKLFLPGIILLLVAALLYSTWLFVDNKSSNGDKTTMKAFVLTTGTYKPIDNGRIVDTLDATIGDQVTAQMLYNTSKVSSIRVELKDLDNKMALKLGNFDVGKDGEFSLSFSTTSLKPGTYKVYVKSDDSKAQALGTIRLSESKKSNN